MRLLKELPFFFLFSAILFICQVMRSKTPSNPKTGEHEFRSYMMNFDLLGTARRAPTQKHL
jgi:hypothetical protein